MGLRNNLYKKINLIEFFFIYIYLKCKGYSSISTFKFKYWHDRVSYIVAVNKKGDKVFIKTSGSYSAAKREFKALTLLSSKTNNQYFPTVLGFINIYIVSFVIIEFIEGETITSKIISKEAAKLFCKSVNESLIRANIIHRDIRPENILVKHSGTPILIDFGWAVIEGDDFYDFKNKKTLRHLGQSFKTGDYNWNDSYSLKKVYFSLFNEEIFLEESPSYRLSY